MRLKHFAVFSLQNLPSSKFNSSDGYAIIESFGKMYGIDKAITSSIYYDNEMLLLVSFYVITSRVKILITRVHLHGTIQ